ncbi:hypothetical protein TIFTF001_008531 [Ficus carica]|uniref:UDP-glucose 4-epimerase n=1 Tax=Ficus carica TaxID=3494 RepID=A0AA88DH38_FICCA|nr:hypothetical protein TIFTF001_008531 [Ficus carica]
MVSSSSATVYGEPERIPCVEDFKLGAKNPYERTKVFKRQFNLIGCAAFDLGTGRGTSVLETVANFEKASGKRKGDASIIYASTEKAEKELGWKAKYGIEEMCRDQWKWASNNPHGYHSQP